MSKLPISGSAPVFVSDGSRALNSEAENLEKQLVLRRQRVRTAAQDLNRKISTKMTSPGMLLAAVGVGAALEQTSHHRAWSLTGMLDATNAGIKLLESVLSVASSTANDCSDSSE